jgi:hypothetical protein
MAFWLVRFQIRPTICNPNGAEVHGQKFTLTLTKKNSIRAIAILSNIFYGSRLSRVNALEYWLTDDAIACIY